MSQTYFPIDKLVIELLCSIFIFCCEVETREDRPLNKRIEDKIDAIQRCSPLSLAHVSQHWRAVAMQLRPIWSFIRVMDNTPLSKIQFWLDQSGTHPLKILIGDVHPKRLREAYDLLASQAYRWSEFRILGAERVYDMPRDIDWHFIPFLKRKNTQPAITAPMLHILHLQVRSSMLLAVDDIMNYPSFSSSKLQKLTVVRINFDWSHLGLHMSFSTITYLDVDQIFHQMETHLQLMQSISQMTALKSLRVYVMFMCSLPLETSLEAIACPMVLSNLQELALRVSGPSLTFWAWVTHLNASRLEHLYLDHYITGRGFDEGPEQQLSQAELARLRGGIRFPSLIHFHCKLEYPFHSGDSRNYDIIAFMPAITTISTMTLVSWSGTDPFLSFLTFDCTFPQLEVVKFLGGLDYPLEDERKLKEKIARLNSDALVTFEDY